MPETPPLSRRERQIVDALYRLGEGTVADVVSQLPDDPGYDAIRVTMAILWRKGVLKRRRQGVRHVFAPAVEQRRAGRSALAHLLKTYFKGSPSRAVLALLDRSAGQLSRDDLDEIAAWVRRARRDAR